MLHIGLAIRLIRRAQDKRIIDVASDAEISNSLLSQIEKGTKSPSVNVIRRIAASLRIPPDVLLILASGTDNAIYTRDKKSSDIARAIKRLQEANDLLCSKINDGAHES